MSRITRKNHFVQQAYLQRWSDDGVNVHAYRLLVSHAGVPLWMHRPISGLAFHTDLYTSAAEGSESDRVERWIEQEYEGPAHEVIDRLVRGEPLDATDWEKIGRYAAAQDVRTPADYLECKARWERELPGMMTDILTRSVNELEDLVSRGMPLPALDTERAATVYEPQLRFPLVVKSRPLEDGGGELGSEMMIGRAMWLASMPIRLAAAERALKNLQWSVLQAPRGSEWFTSDRPLMRLNYYEEGKFDFGGGWGSPGSELVMPLSPEHLLYTKVGHAGNPKVVLTFAQMSSMQQLLARNALRWVFARREAKRVEWMRPRTVDAEQFKYDEQQWRNWHAEQSAAEKEIFDAPPPPG